MKIGDRIRIVRNINGDDTPIGSRGTVCDILIDGTVIITLDDVRDELYYTSKDADDWEIIS